MVNINTNDEYKKYFGKAMPQIIHDIRNPLNIIIGFSSIMQIDDTISQENAQYLQKIYLQVSVHIVKAIFART